MQIGMEAAFKAAQERALRDSQQQQAEADRRLEAICSKRFLKNESSLARQLAMQQVGMQSSCSQYMAVSIVPASPSGAAASLCSRSVVVCTAMCVLV